MAQADASSAGRQPVTAEKQVLAIGAMVGRAAIFTLVAVATHLEFAGARDGEIKALACHAAVLYASGEVGTEAFRGSLINAGTARPHGVTDRGALQVGAAMLADGDVRAGFACLAPVSNARNSYSAGIGEDRLSP